MTHVFNDPVAFREEMIDGFCAAYGRMVRRVPDASGVMTSAAPTPGKVAVIVGGGSGHYPAFYGFVGEGLAAAAVIGEVFASPSGEQAYRVAKAVHGGAGVLFCLGNYSGDVMNFGMAESRLRADGIDARTVLVTDDVLSSSPRDAEKRRGVAGGFFVFKIAGASAARGDNLDVVEGLSRKANARVRSAGVAFAGCTIPGQPEPLFTVAGGMMEIGLGIHGERGVRSSERLSAKEIAKLLVDTVLAEAPAGAGSRTAVLVNGLGATKSEELFVLYHDIAPLLAAAGVDAYEPQIGEFVTSLNMAGCSLSLCWLDDELNALYDAAATSPAFTKIGQDSVHSATIDLMPAESAAPIAPTELVEAGNSGSAGTKVRVALAAAREIMHIKEDELGRLDAVAGDGDHGAGMVRGFRAATGEVAGFTGTAQQTLIRAGQAFMNAAGGASGALVGVTLTALGEALPENDDQVDATMLGAALAASLERLCQVGEAQPGEKTMIDTLDPFVTAFQAAAATGAATADAWAAALPAARAGMKTTAGMISQRGRAARLGERSLGHRDPGAASIYYVLQAVGESLMKE
ncbi:MAG: dihydroxyacetone kinase subunit DhaL [Thermomicrobiales bacterium]